MGHVGQNSKASMSLLGFNCSGYKAFKSETQIHLRPLTLFFGRNNSGKSTLLRLPILLLRAMSSRAKGGFPLAVDSLNFGESFSSLTFSGLAHGAAGFRIRLAIDGEVLDATATVQNIQNMHPSTGEPREFSIVSRLRIEDPPIELVWEPHAASPNTYKGYGKLGFRGLLPDPRASSSCGDLAFINRWRSKLEELEDRLCYLGPIRSNIPRFFESGTSNQLGSDGSGAVSLLSQDRQLLERVSNWFETNLGGWSISLDYAGSAFRCLLRRNRISVNLADVGHGIQQVLPVVVQQLAHSTGSSNSVIDLVEQPELHLHAAAQAPLADLFIDTAHSADCQLVVETHSENLLLRLRRRIAEGLDPSFVRIYFIDETRSEASSVRPIEILPDGSVDWWPKGVFSEGYEELKALSRAARSPGP